jgi:Cof subfamily protein (haloacid dehalogenase superfamily)
MIQLLILDLDGTIVGSRNQISAPVKAALKAVQEKGVNVAIATGRMYRSALRFHQDIGSTLPLMSYQGALIKDPRTEQVLRHWTLSTEGTFALLDYLEQPDLRHRLSVHCYINDALYVREITAETEAYALRSSIPPHAVGDLRQIVSQSAPTKLLALSDDEDLVDQVYRGLQQQYSADEFYFTKSVATFLEAADPRVNKGTAVKYLAEELLGLQPEQVMCVGDNFNDVEMIQYAGVGVAMGDAPDDVKAIANWVATGVETDGVLEAIAKFIG